MRKRTKALILGVTPLVVAAGIGSAALAGGPVADPAAERHSEAAYTDAHRADATISQPAAERVALRARPGIVVESHLESEGHGLRWEVKVAGGNRVWEIQIDPATGAVQPGGRAD